jgi:O-antigen/teichoic acid export membrane protein
VSVLSHFFAVYRRLFKEKTFFFLPNNAAADTSYGNLLSFQKLRQTLSQSAGLQLSILTIASYLLAAALAALTSIAISRFLGPVDFGLFTTAATLSLLANQFNSFGLSQVIQKYVGGEEDHGRMKRLLSVCLRYRFLLSLLIVAIVLLFATPIANFFHLESKILIVIAVLAGLAPAYLESSQVMLQSVGKLKFAAANYLLPALLKLLLAVAIFFWQLDNVALILALYLLSTLPSILLAEAYRPKWLKYQVFHSFPAEEKLVLAMLRHTAFAVVAAGVIDNLDLLLAKHYLSDYETGILAGANRIALLLSVVSGALASVLFPRVAKYHDQHNLKRFLQKALLLTALLVPTFFLIKPFAPLLIHYSIGPEYLPGSAALEVLLTAGIITIISVPYIAPFYAFRSNRYFSIAASLQLLIIFLGNWLYLPQYGLMASAVTRLIAKAALLLFTFLALRHNWRKEFVKK